MRIRVTINTSNPCMLHIAAFEFSFFRAWNFPTRTDVRQSLHQIRQQIAEECEFLWICLRQLSSAFAGRFLWVTKA